MAWVALRVCLAVAGLPFLVSATGAATPIRVELHYGPGDELLAADVRREVESALTFYPPEVLERAAREGPILLVRVAVDQRQFFEWSGGRSPEWAAGLTMDGGRTILLMKSSLVDRARMRQLIRHEVAHSVLEMMLRGQHVPRWFHEGFAQMRAAEWNLQAMGRLSLVGWLRRAIPLREIDRHFPWSGPRARLAYAEAQAAVLELARDPEAWSRLLELLAEGRSFDDALSAAYGMDRAAFDRHFEEVVMKRYRRLGFQYSGSAILLVMIGLLLAGAWRARRRALAAAEPPKSNGNKEQESFWRGRGWIDRGRGG